MRVNSNIPSYILADEHLLAEHLELKMIATSLKNSIRNSHVKHIPESFRLGEGHVLFFMNKFEFLYNRFLAVHHECISRGFHVTDYSASFLEMKNSEYWNDWQSSKSADKILINRIIEKIQSSPKHYFMYYSQPITKDELIGRYINYINKYI